MPLQPAIRQILIKQEFHFGFNPGWHMDTVGNRLDRPVLCRLVAPEIVPHPVGNFPVFLADTVFVSGEPEGKGGHVKAKWFVGVGAELQKGFSVKSQGVPEFTEIFFNQRKRKDVMASWYRGVGGKNRCFPNLIERVLKGQALEDSIPDPLQ